jgi:hypothetical protein
MSKEQTKRVKITAQVGEPIPAKLIAETNERVKNSMKKFIKNIKEKPYIITKKVVVEENWQYNPKFGDHKVCICGHSYYRHFDTYEEMSAVGCKYCQCYRFKEAPPMPRSFVKKGMSETDALNAYHNSLEKKHEKKNRHNH